MKVVSFSIKVPTSCKGDYVKASKTIKYFSLGVLIGATGIVLSSKLNKKSVDDIVVDTADNFTTAVDSLVKEKVTDLVDFIESIEISKLNGLGKSTVDKVKSKLSSIIDLF